MLNLTHNRPWKAFLVVSLFMLLLSLPAVAKDSQRGWLGVTLQDIDSEIAEKLDMDNDDGVLINEVLADSPAEEAGLQDGDIIIEFDGRKVLDYKALTKAVRRSSPGQKVEVKVLRDGKKKKFDVELGERGRNTWVFSGDEGKNVKVKRLHEKLRQKMGDDDVFVWNNGEGDKDMQVMVQGLKRDRGFLGVELDNLSDQMGEYFEVKDGEGALISKVIDDSAADKAGLKAGDVIVRMGDEQIGDSGDVHDVLAETKPKDEMKIEIVRKGKNKTLELTLGALPDDFGLGNMEFFGDDGSFTVRAPKMLFHGDGDFPRMEREIRIHGDDKEELEELKSELEQLKEELQKLKDELKK